MRTRAVSWSVKLARPLAALSVAFAASVALASCSDSVEDSVSRACEVIQGCKVDTAVGDCIDLLGDQEPECTDCIQQSGCDYPTCQRDPIGCRIPTPLLPQE